MIHELNDFEFICVVQTIDAKTERDAAIFPRTKALPDQYADVFPDELPTGLHVMLPSCMFVWCREIHL